MKQKERTERVIKEIGSLSLFLFPSWVVIAPERRAAAARSAAVILISHSLARPSDPEENPIPRRLLDNMSAVSLTAPAPLSPMA